MKTKEDHRTIWIDESKFLVTDIESLASSEEIKFELIERVIGCLKGKGIYLHCDYDWEIVQDDLGCLVLIARRK